MEQIKPPTSTIFKQYIKVQRFVNINCRNQYKIQKNITALISRWQISALSKRAFCREHKIGYLNFNYGYSKSLTKTTVRSTA